MRPTILPAPACRAPRATLALARRGAVWIGCLALATVALAQSATALDDPTAADVALSDRLAQDPTWAPALAYRTPATAVAERALREAQSAARRSHTGWGAALTLEPSVAWRGSPGAPASAPRWRSDVGGELSVRHDPVVVARAALDLHRAEVALQARAFRDLREALTLHVDLHRAYLARTLLEQTAVDRAATLADAEAAEGAAPESLTSAAARLAAERAAADVERAARAVAEAERAAAEAGFDPAFAAADHRDRTRPLPLEGWRLALPDVEPDATPAVVAAARAAELAAATLARAQVGSTLEDLWLDTSLTLPAVRLRASLDVDEGRPGAAFDVTLRSASRPSWSVALGASLRLEDGTFTALERARADVDEAGATLAAARAEAPRLLALARQAALDAEADVAFAERALAIGRAGLAEAVERWRRATGSTGPGPADTTAGPADALSEAADTVAARARADAALVRVAIGFERERDAFLRAWATYLLQVERYLAVAGSSGGVVAPP